MPGNSNLHDSSRNKQDEFYTNLQLVEDELKHYRAHFRGKRVLCNCDDPYESNFFKYFARSFEILGLKRVIATCYKSHDIDLFTVKNCEKAVYQIYDGDANGNREVDDEEIAAASIGTNLYGYAYDTIGNRLWSSANSTTSTYTANSLNQYTFVSAGANPVYDTDGNMTGDGTFAYAYDVENRLLSVYPSSPLTGSLAVVNRYDHRHRRVQKIVKRYDGTTWGVIESHTFVWDSNNIVLEKIAFADDTTRMCEYFWGADKSGTEQGAGGVEGLMAVSIDGVFYIPCYDHNGNIVRYVSEAGSIAAQYTYDPYGNITDMSGSLATQFSFGFSTKYHDREIGKVSYQRRFYLPSLMRWLNRDPIEERGGENLYVFCFNAAPCKYDVLGAKTCCRDGKKMSCDDYFKWTGSMTVASVTRVLGVTFLMVDLVSNYICSACKRHRLHAKAVLPTISIGAPISLTGSEIEFGNVPPDAFAGSVTYGAVGFGAMGVAEASYLELGNASAFSAGIVGGGEAGAGMGYGWYIDFELIEE